LGIPLLPRKQLAARLGLPSASSLARIILRIHLSPFDLSLLRHRIRCLVTRSPRNGLACPQNSYRIRRRRNIVQRKCAIASCRRLSINKKYTIVDRVSSRVASISDRNFMDAEPCLASLLRSRSLIASSTSCEIYAETYAELLVNEINKVTLYKIRRWAAGCCAARKSASSANVELLSLPVD